MKNYLAAYRYARSLSETIDDDQALEPTLEILTSFTEIFRESEALQGIIGNPAVPTKTQMAILDAILEKLGADSPLKKLVAALVQRGRARMLPEVTKLFAAQTDARLNRVSAQVTSAVALSDTQRNDIIASLEKFSGMHVRIDHAVDPDLLGGVIAQIGGTIIDGSVRARIERLKQSLLPEENLGG